MRRKGFGYPWKSSTDRAAPPIQRADLKRERELAAFNIDDI
jgi:hypothetical protein